MKPASLIAVLVFAAIAVAHLLRLLFGVDVVVGGVVLGMWLSVVGFFVAAALAVALAREGRELGR